MPDRIIEAQAVISAKDATGDVFVNIARKLGEIGKGAKASAEVERLSKTLADASKQAEKIGQFRVASKTLDEASLSMAKAKQTAAQLAKQIEGMDKPTATMTGKLNQAEREVTRSTEAFKRQGQAVRDARGALEAAGVPLGKLGAEQTRLKSVIEGTTRALEHQIGVERQAAEMAAKVAEAEKREAAARVQAERVAERAAHKRQHDIAHHSIGNYVAGAAAGAVSAHGVMSALEKALEAGAERQTTIIGMRNAGMGEEEIKRAVDLATKTSRDAPNLDISQILELHKEARSGVSHPEEAFHLIPDLARATSVLKGLGADNANIADIVKGGESLGLMNDPHRFHTYLDSQVRAMKVMGKTITTEQIYEAAKYSKAAGGTLSDDFLNLTMPSLIQEMHGSSAGDALSAVTKTLRGGLQHKHVPVTRLKELGLLEAPSKIRRSKSGEILGYTGKVKGDDLLATDPDLWFLEYFDKAAEAHGYTKLADKTKLLSETLPGTAANLGRIVIQQRESLTNHRQLYKNAPNLEQSVELQKHDPKVAMQTFTAALNDLEAAVTGPAMDTISLGLGKISGAVRDLADAAKAHPNIAMGVGAGAATAGLAGSGYLAYLLTTGFGLPGAATHLEASAIALDAAAGKIGVSGAASGAVNAAENAAGGAAGLGFFGRMALGFGFGGAAAFVGDAMLNRRNHDKAMIEGAHPDVLPSDNNLGLPGADGGAPSDNAEAAKRSADAAKQAGQAAAGAWDWVKTTAVGLGFGDRLHAEAPGVPLPPERLSGYTGSGHDGNALHRWDEAPANRAVAAAAIVPAPAGSLAPPALAFHTDDDRATRSRTSDADPWARQLQEKEEQQIWQFGQLNERSGVLQASFTTLDGGAGTLNTSFGTVGTAAGTAGTALGTLGTGVESASHELDVLALAARTASTAFAALLSAAAGGAGGSGIINASFGGGMSGGSWNGNPLAVAGGFGGAGWTKSGATRPEVAAYIKAQAARLGIDPNVALRVAQSEGLNTYVGDYGTSFGAFQLHYGGSGIRGMNSGGLGDRFTRETGQSAKDPTTWRAQVDYALKTAKREGWGAWHGARHVGIGNRQGLDWHGKAPEEHPALAPLPPRRPAADHGTPSGRATTAKLDELNGSMRQLVAAVERGGLHRVEIKAHRSLVAQKTYSRGGLGVTTA